MPQPRWVTRGLPDGPGPAWVALAEVIAARAESGPISIYVHLPFCETRCPFCDCHATVAPRTSRDAVDRYLEELARELVRWASLPGIRTRPVTTVHFGGGTPLSVGADAFGGVVSAIRDALGTHAGTEWALESTSRLLGEEHLDLLSHLDFTRIHVGVQTLDPAQRHTLGRREPPHRVIERIEACLERGWVVSADLLYGLPGQTAEALRADIAYLTAAGVHGVSLYHLNAGPYNHAFMERHGLGTRDEARLSADFALLAEGAALLESLGYRRNHLTHFARPQDGNLYSRHALRGEDLLALGSSADGVFGDYFYRHVEVERYAGSAPSGPAGAGHPPLAGGGRFTTAEVRARPLVTQLMAAEVRPHTLDARLRDYAAALAAAGLLRPAGDGPSGPSGATLTLTDAGSWFAGAIAAELWDLYAPC
jgi:oxygen-independent coproporphyrinogen-3 oxidase